jgi:hypothetical protein
MIQFDRLGLLGCDNWIGFLGVDWSPVASEACSAACQAVFVDEYAYKENYASASSTRSKRDVQWVRTERDDSQDKQSPI